MPLTYVSGNIFESPAETLVNTVNTVGAMGKGIAYKFKLLYPEMFSRYRSMCERGELTVGRLFLYRTEHKSVLNFPTKEHWRNPSKVVYLEEGLKTFVRTYETVGIHSVAFPALGCGHGGLDFKTQVQPMMETWLRKVACRVFIYPHKNSYQLPEHRNIRQMKKWLRSTPSDLSFVEVWEDLREVLSRRTTYTPFTTTTKYSATLTTDPAGIRIERSRKRWHILYDDLLDFWQQLRSFGFASSRFAPSNRSRDISYIAPIFAELQYIEPVRIASGYADDSDFDRYAEYALQFIPPPSDIATTDQFDLLPAAG